MDSQAITSRSELESMLFDESIEPKALTLSLLEDITNSFSEDKEIGSGGFAVVYEGKLDDGIVVAVKKLFETLDIHEKKFTAEVSCLMKVKHKNIVRFLGYCSHTQQEMVDYDGELVLEPVGEKLLCFEYLPNGSLDKKISDASCGLEWRNRYQIITGICDGLNYLHENNIIHLDLKPSNILLDENMMPKIADFGLSRCFDENQNQIIMSKPIGTMGYLPVESHGGGHITIKTDIYSLGIIIMEILTGERGYTDIEDVLESWRNRLEKSQTDKQLVQVQVCAEIGMQCCNYNPVKRPDIQHIVDRLHATRSADESTTQTGMSSGSSAAKLAVVLPGLTTGLEYIMANAVLKSKEELHNVTNQNQSFSSMPDNSSNVQQVPTVPEDVEGALIIGKTGEKKTEEKETIVSILSGSVTEDMVILPIYGIGGIGKTTLARLVFKDPQFQDYSHVWVYVSEMLNLNKIGNSIISQLTDEISQVANKQMLHNRLRKLFTGKSILIVLDDLWEKHPDKLNDLMTMLKLGTRKKVIVIVTTRDEAIARIISDPAVPPYKLETLTDSMCWTIIKQKTHFEDRVDKKQLEHIGREIATKCGGMALVAQSLGYMLLHMTSDQWESVRDNNIWTNPSSYMANNDVFASLWLNFSHMPDWLKLCFSYCAVFPKGQIIVKYDLMHQWIALGFTEQSGLFDPMQLCEAYVTQLLEMSFLQYTKIQHSSDGHQDKYGPLLTMPDIVHDLARAILADLLNDKDSAGGNRCRYAVLTNCSKPLQLSVTFPENIKALHFLDCRKLKLHGDAFSLAMRLHVLDLSECFIQKLPDSIGGLKQLRFLHAPRIQDQIIPNCISELSELTYLNLRGSNILVLPESIGDMKGLMHLDLSGCNGIDELPVSFTELKQLVHLDLSHCRMSMPEALGGFTNLQYLNLSVEFTMYAKHMREQTEFISNLIKLRYLNLSGRMKLMAPSEDQIHGLIYSISRLSNLEHLDLSRNVELSSIPESIGNLTKLHTLDLLGCSNLRNLPNSIVKIVNLNVLHEASLVESTLSRLNFGSLPHFVVHASSDKSNSNIIRLQPTNPNKLTIDRLEHVKSAEEAQSIKLREKQKIEELTFRWTIAAERFVDDKEVLEQLMPSNSVRRLSIAGYRSVSIPDWLMGIRQHLPNLNRIELHDFVKCNKLPSLNILPNLRFMCLSRMDSLEEWNTTHSSGEEGVNEPIFPKLRTLIIEQCAKLRIKPCLPRCHVLHITDSDNVLSSSEESSSHSGASSSSPAINLSVDGSKVPLHQWRLLHELPAVRSLTIKHCGDLTTSPEIIKCLSSLESLCLESLSFDQAELPRWLVELTSIKALSLSKSRNLTSLPEWLGDLSSLKKIEILCCQGIRSLPDSIQQMAKLEYLKIRGCPTLRKWCESKENKMKLTHITEKHIW